MTTFKAPPGPVAATVIAPSPAVEPVAQTAAIRAEASQAGTIKADAVVPVAPAVERAFSWGVRARIGAIVVTHSAVDFFSYFLIPILTVLEGRLSLTPTQGAVLVGVGSISSGLIQPLVALISDRYKTPWPGVLGMLLCVAAYSLLGYANSFQTLLLLQILGSAGSGAFHPVAAATMGHLTARRRTVGISVFFMAGMIGGIAGNAFTPTYVKALSVEALWYFLLPGVLATVIMAWAVYAGPARGSVARTTKDAVAHVPIPHAWRGVGILYLGNAIRFTVNMMLVQLLVRLTEAAVLTRAGATVLTSDLRIQAAAINGPLQAAMQIGMGVAGLALGYVLTPRRERVALVVGPVVGGLIVIAFPYVPTSLAFGMAIGAGMAYAGLIPTTISMAQRFLPHRTTLASALMLGGAWAVAAAGPPLVQAMIDAFGLSTAFGLTGVLLAMSGLVGLALPKDPVH